MVYFQNMPFSDIYIAVFFILSFLVLGAGVKYIDEAFDKETFSRKKALILAPFLGLLYAFLMSLHQTAATLLLAFLAGVFISGKINNYAFYLQTLFFGVFVFLFDHIYILFFPFLILVGSSVIDEKGNDLSDKKKISNKHLDSWFRYRLTMDFVALLLALFGFIEIVFFIAFLSFDIGYTLVGEYSKKTAKNKSTF